MSLTKIVSTTTFVPEPANCRYKTFNFALLHTKGLRNFLDFLRYERAFLARRSDLELLVEASKSPEKAILGRFSLLVCRYDYKSITTPSWTMARLLRHQELQTLSDHQELMTLSSDYLDFKPRAPFKFRGRCEFKDIDIVECLRIMDDNKAMIANDRESDCHNVEDYLLGYKTGKFDVALENFQHDEKDWVMPR